MCRLLLRVILLRRLRVPSIVMLAHVDIVQAQFLILVETALVYLDDHIRVFVRRVWILDVRVGERVVDDEREFRLRTNTIVKRCMKPSGERAMPT